jgi:platelet-activating factor acetylhydrolase
LWENDGTDPVKAPEMMLWRAHQLDFRVREVHAAYDAFKRYLADAPLRDKVNVTDLQLTGHSFGGATILRLLQTSPTLPVKRAVLLDPWLEPFSRALPSAPATAPPPPTQVVLSGEWANNGFFASEVQAARELGASLCSIVGLGHQGFSDFGVMGVKSIGRQYLQSVHALTMARLRDVPFPFDGEADGGEPHRVDGKLAGELGDVVRHL